MPVSSSWGDPTIVPQLVAQDIHSSVSGLSVSVQDLTDAIAEITPETQTAGAALLQVQLIDPAFRILRSGLLDRDAEGFLPKVDVNFPRGTDVWWRLAMEQHQSVDATGGSPNLTLTFRHRIVSYLARCWSPLGWPHGKKGSTRAQFLKMLVDRMPSELPKGERGPGPDRAVFICPAINEIQPIASSNIFGTEVITSQQASARKAGINKLPLLTAAAKVTVQGQKPSALQIRTINTILGEGQSLGAPTEALIASMYAAMGESAINPNAPGGGTFQGTSFPNPSDVAGEARAFFQGGQGFGNGFSPAMGAIAAARKGLPAWQIANGVEDNAVWGGPGGAHGDSYAHQWPGGQAQGIAEATALVNAFGGGTLAGLAGSGGAQLQPVSDIAELTRGTADNPDEDSWTCMQRLAAEENWSLFSSPQPHPGVWGNFIFFMDGPTLVAQKPSLYVELSDDGTTYSARSPDGKVLAGDGVITALSGANDDTAVQYQVTRKVKGKVQHKTRVATPQTPTQLRFNMLSGVMEFCAGIVAVMHNAGPDNGRWIVEDVTHNALGDLFAQFTLGPPVYPYPEPQAGSVASLGTAVKLPSTGAGSAGASGLNGVQTGGVDQGLIASVAQAALKALRVQQTTHRYHYSEPAADRSASADLFKVTYMDCSSFATLCYKAAGLPDPNHQNYSPIGWTGSLIAHCRRISQGDALPGDLCFFGPSEHDTKHVNVYVGNGQSVSMGSEGEPAEGPAAQMGPAGFLGFYRSDVASTVAVSKPANPVQSGVQHVAAPVLSVTGTVVQSVGGIFQSIFEVGGGGDF